MPLSGLLTELHLTVSLQHQTLSILGKKAGVEDVRQLEGNNGGRGKGEEEAVATTLLAYC